MYNMYDSSQYIRSPRDEIIIEGLKRNGVHVDQCNFPVPKPDIEIKDKISFVIAVAQIFLKEWGGYLKITAEFFKKKCWKSDAIVVGSPWKFDVFFAFALSRIFRKPLIFDIFNSYFETDVLDRKAVKPNSVHAARLWLLDKLACSAADVLLMDTGKHKDFLAKIFDVPEKIKTLFIGADDRIYFPKETKKHSKKFTVFFCGTAIPLQGIETIFEAAFLLRHHTDIHFQLVGIGHFPQWQKKLDESGLKNIELFDLLKPTESSKKLLLADVALGIFGDTEKAKRVVPHKAFEAMACAKPIITEVSPAALEVFSNGKNAILVEPKNPRALAEAILLLKKNKRLKCSIGAEGYNLFKKRFSTKAIGKEMKNIIEETIRHAE